MNKFRLLSSILLLLALVSISMAQGGISSNPHPNNNATNMSGYPAPVVNVSNLNAEINGQNGLNQNINYIGQMVLVLQNKVQTLIWEVYALYVILIITIISVIALFFKQRKKV